MNLDALAYQVAIEMLDEFLPLSRHGVEHQRMGRAEDQQMADDVSAGVERESLAPLARLQTANVVRRKIVQKRGSIFAGQLDLRPVVAIDESDAGGEGGVFR